MSVAEWDDPEPLAEFDAKGQQPLYNVNDDDTNGLSRKLRIDALVSKIGSTNNGQREHMVETISEFSHDHRQGLSWLERRHEQQSWTADSLMLFLVFHTYWNTNRHLWVGEFWDPMLACWCPTSNHYSLSWDACLLLVQRRFKQHPNCHPDEVVDGSWLRDWREMTMWRHGFWTFASFAVFRSGFGPDENWRSQVDWYESDDSIYDDDDPEFSQDWDDDLIW